MRRRAFITLLGGTATWPLLARAQQKPPTIGFLAPSTPATEGLRTTSFLQRLRDLGWIKGRTVAIEARWAEGRRERATEIADEFVKLKVGVIVTGGATAVIQQIEGAKPYGLVKAIAPKLVEVVKHMASPSSTTDVARNR